MSNRSRVSRSPGNRLRASRRLARVLRARFSRTDGCRGYPDSNRPQYMCDRSRGILVAARLLAHILQKSAHRVELRAEARPVSGFQALHCLIVVVERLPRPICRGARERRSRCGTRSRRRSASFEERRQCLGERLLHHHMFTIRCDHAFELRQVSMLRPQIERRYIEDRVLDGDHKQVRAADHPRAHLVPQRELLGDFGILIDPCLDLERPVDELLLRKLVDNQLAVVGRIAARGEPRDHVVAAARHHREHDEELGLSAPRAAA